MDNQQETVIEWNWLQDQVSWDQISWYLAKAENSIIDYASGSVLGFPGTVPYEESLAAFTQFSARHPNNLGCHTRRDGAENGFPGTQRLEREFIYEFSRVLGISDPPEDIDGYICFGGTDGNESGLWVGRNWLRRDKTGKLRRRPAVAVLGSFHSHYSVRKACDKLGMNFYRMPTNDAGELTLDILERKIRKLYERGVRRFIVFLNAGAINMGSIDQIPEICAFLEKLGAEYGPELRFYVHVDAAFGGYVIPFLEPQYPFAFHNPAVDSISVDAHKMGFVPYPAGLFFCRKNRLDVIARPIGYVGGHMDETTCGSRPGASAAACWAALHALGFAGYQQIVKECMAVRNYLEMKLTALGAYCFPSRMNILAVRFSSELEAAVQNLQNRYCLVNDEFPKRFSDLRSGKQLIFRFVIMPHLKRGDIDRFISDLTRPA